MQPELRGFLWCYQHNNHPFFERFLQFAVSKKEYPKTQCRVIKKVFQSLLRCLKGYYEVYPIVIWGCQMGLGHNIFQNQYKNFRDPSPKEVYPVFLAELFSIPKALFR